MVFACVGEPEPRAVEAENERNSPSAVSEVESAQTLPEEPPKTPSAPADELGAEDVRAYRLDVIAIRDPHTFIEVGTCFDMTKAVSDLAQATIALVDDDAVYKRSLVILVREGGAEVEFRAGRCHSREPNECRPSLEPGAEMVHTTGDIWDSACDIVDPTTLRPYPRKPNVPQAPCIVSSPKDMTFALGEIKIPLEDAQLAAETTTRGLEKGVLRGFLAADVAASVILPEKTALVGGLPLAHLFAGDKNSCQKKYSDKDSGPTGHPGWWMHFDFEASPVAWVTDEGTATF